MNILHRVPHDPCRSVLPVRRLDVRHRVKSSLHCSDVVFKTPNLKFEFQMATVHESFLRWFFTPIPSILGHGRRSFPFHQGYLRKLAVDSSNPAQCAEDERFPGLQEGKVRTDVKDACSLHTMALMKALSILQQLIRSLG